MRKALKLRNAIGLAMLAPVLMSALPPEYRSQITDYTDIDISIVKRTDTPSGEPSVFDFTVKNTGRYYVVEETGLWWTGDGNGGMGLGRYSKSAEYGGETLIRSGEAFSFVFSTSRETIDFDRGVMTATAYFNLAGGLTYTGTKAISLSQDGIYVVDCVVSGMKDRNDYEYSFALVMDYQGSEHCFTCSLRDDNKLYFKVQKEGFAPEEASIIEVIAFQNQIYRTNYAGLAMGGMLYAAIPWLITIVVSVGIGIVVGVVVHSRKKKRTIDEE